MFRKKGALKLMAAKWLEKINPFELYTGTAVGFSTLSLKEGVNHAIPERCYPRAIRKSRPTFISHIGAINLRNQASEDTSSLLAALLKS